MSLTYIATLPESMTVSDVVSFDVTSASQPRTILARRSGLDELVYDEDGGFTDAWKGFSSLTPTSGGFTLVLGRRAFSAAGVAVLFAGGGGGAGGTLGGDVTGPAGTNTVVKVQGVPIAAPVTTGNVPHFDGANIVWGAPSVGSGDVVGPSSAVADSVATYNGITGKLIKDGGKTIAQIEASAAATAVGTAKPAYMGYSLSSVVAPGSSWTALTSLCTVTDSLQDRITRSGSTLTFTEAGRYMVSWDINIAPDALVSTYIAQRARVSGVTVLSHIHYSTSFTTSPIKQTNAETFHMQGIVTMLAAGTMTLEACEPSGTGATWGPSTVDGDTHTRTMNLSVFKL
jgi:hypothetical protein